MELSLFITSHISSSTLIILHKCNAYLATFLCLSQNSMRESGTCWKGISIKCTNENFQSNLSSMWDFVKCHQWQKILTTNNYWDRKLLLHVLCMYLKKSMSWIFRTFLFSCQDMSVLVLCMLWSHAHICRKINVAQGYILFHAKIYLLFVKLLQQTIQWNLSFKTTLWFS